MKRKRKSIIVINKFFFPFLLLFSSSFTVFYVHIDLILNIKMIFPFIFASSFTSLSLLNITYNSQVFLIIPFFPLVSPYYLFIHDDVDTDGAGDDVEAVDAVTSLLLLLFS